MTASATTGPVVLAHAPNEAWDCCACGLAWPCEEARDDLRALHANRPTDLAVHMAQRLGRAAGVLATVAPDRLYLRFIAWTRPVLDEDHAAALR